jgi:hypothetical protein
MLALCHFDAHWRGSTGVDGVIDSGFVLARPSGQAILPELAVFLAGCARLSSQK